MAVECVSHGERRNYLETDRTGGLMQRRPANEACNRTGIHREGKGPSTVITWIVCGTTERQGSASTLLYQGCEKLKVEDECQRLPLYIRMTTR